MSLVSVAEVQAIIRSPLGEDDLQDVIDREEAMLARRIGPLSGPRTVTWTSASGAALWLRRPTAAVVVTEYGVTTSGSYLALTSGGRGLQRLVGGWRAPVTVTFTPTDEAEVKAALIELVGMRLAMTGYQSETIEGYSYTAPTQAERDRIVRGLIPASSLGSVRMGS